MSTYADEVAIPLDVQRQALHPFREVTPPVGWDVVERDGVSVCVHPLPIAKVVEPTTLHPGAVESALATARAVVRERGSSLAVWCIASEHAEIGDRLELLGLVNEETPGFEIVENAMALIEAPAGGPSSDVAVREVESFEDFRASSHVMASAFEMPQAMREEMEATLGLQFEEYSSPGNSARQFNASIDGEVVGTAAAVRGSAAINLFGGSVIAEARGRGVYRALMRARWNFAVDQGTPALTVQAGKMSMPIAERLGFTLVGQIRMLVDDFADEQPE
jgi:GNAT superfamily N-acetyltransferase